MTSRDPLAGRHAVAPAPRGRWGRPLVALAVLVLVTGVIGGVVVGGRRLLGSPATVRAMVVGPVLAGAEAGLGGPTVAGDGPDVTSTPSAPGSAPSASPSPTAAPIAQDRAAAATADRAAGLLRTVFPQHGGGRLNVVPGASPAPGAGPVKRVRVEVEAGLPIDGAVFAGFVLQTLNDPRSWGHGGRMTFARTSGAYDIRVVLASPDTSARMCLPLQTMGTLSCGKGNTAVLTMFRWVNATAEFGPDRTEYRRYVVNHEVGHTLGHGHLMCPGPGKVAPVMMQQTKGLKGCRANGWPFP